MKFQHCSRTDGRFLENAYDVSSRGDNFWSLFSPFHQFRNIPHPLSKEILCVSVEAIWQGSKVFDKDDIKPDYFILFGKKDIRKAKGKKPLGHWNGKGGVISDVGKARRKIYIPAYEWVLENRLRKQIEKVLDLALDTDEDEIIYLYDFDNNTDPDDPAPLSHASVLANYLNMKYDCLGDEEDD